VSGQTSNNNLELFRRLGSDDQQAFTTLFHEYNASLQVAVTKLIKSSERAREIIQDVFLKLWLNRNKVSEMQNPQGWLFTVASNLCFDALRQQARQPVMAEVNEDEMQAGMDPSILLESKEMQEMINEAVDKLPGARKQIFDLSRRSGLNRKQIAEQLNISEHTVKNQLTASLKFVQAYLKDKGADIPFQIMAIIFFLSR
jgi:RNA polymerase sigma-70 factor (family 1)